MKNNDKNPEIFSYSRCCSLCPLYIEQQKKQNQKVKRQKKGELAKIEEYYQILQNYGKGLVSEEFHQNLLQKMPQIIEQKKTELSNKRNANSKKA